MSARFRLTLAQLDPTVGDLAGNARLAAESWAAAKAAGADIVAFPEMFLTGYQPQDLVLKPAFTADAMRAVEAAGGRLRRRSRPRDRRALCRGRPALQRLRGPAGRAR